MCVHLEQLMPDPGSNAYQKRVVPPPQTTGDGMSVCSFKDEWRMSAGHPKRGGLAAKSPFYENTQNIVYYSGLDRHSLYFSWLCHKIRRLYKGEAKTCIEIWHDEFDAGLAIPPTLGKRVVLRCAGQKAGKRNKTSREL
jgi:hypothetical protein